MLREFTFKIPLTRFGIGLSITNVVDFERAASENRIVQTAGVVDNRHHLAGQRRPEHAAFAKEDVARHLNRVRCMIAFFGLVGVEAQKIDRLLSLEVNETQILTVLQPPTSRLTRRNDIVTQYPAINLDAVDGHALSPQHPLPLGIRINSLISATVSPIPVEFAGLEHERARLQLAILEAIDGHHFRIVAG